MDPRQVAQAKAGCSSSPLHGLALGLRQRPRRLDRWSDADLRIQSWGLVWMSHWWVWWNIRRPRQTQGGARQGIRHLTLVGLLLLLLPLLLLLLLGLRVRLRLRLRVSKKMSGCWFLALEAVVSQPLARSLLWSRCPQAVLQGHCVSLSGSVRFQLREEEQQQQQEQQEGSMSHYVSLYKQRYKKWSKTIVFLGFQKGR